MRVRVRVGEETFEVEVGDVSERPVIAMVDGMRFEVWPEGAGAPAEGIPSAPAPLGTPEPRPDAPDRSPDAPSGPASPGDGRSVRAPIPGVIDSILVHPGDSVVRGQDLLVLEAMKMKNVIRAARAGTTAAVHVALGQHVKHGDPLVELQD
ncbi:MAG TPA: biotin/lipoyl-binding protein [Anaerolineae bacterium]|nr:biotin/lipoyl-binding protein [Anaerolineae bacterium]